MDRRLIFVFDKAHRKLFRTLDNHCQKTLDITLTQLGALMFIVKNPGCLQKAVGDALDLNKSAITGLLTRMQARELIERRGDSGDARAMCVYATEPGIKTVRAAKPWIKKLNQQLQENFSESEMNTIFRFLSFIDEHY